MTAGLVTTILISYLLGAIPTSIWIGKALQGVDIRMHGSGNAGATNTFRILGWKAGSLVALIDLVKGFTAAFFVSWLGLAIAGYPDLLFGAEAFTLFQLIAGTIAVLGHMYPVYVRFNGGKGVITAAGMLFAIEPISISLTLIVFLAVMFSTRYVSVGSITGAIVYPLFLIILQTQFDMEIANSLLFFTIAIGLIIIFRHRSNIKRLIEGNENRIRSFKPSKGRINEEQVT